MDSKKKTEGFRGVGWGDGEVVVVVVETPKFVVGPTEHG